MAHLHEECAHGRSATGGSSNQFLVSQMIFLIESSLEGTSGASVPVQKEDYRYKEVMIISEMAWDPWLGY